MSFQAADAIRSSDTIVGYGPYVDMLERGLVENKRIITSGMRKEVERCRVALDAAAEGAHVSLISSGDAGIYGMAGLALEMNSGVEIEIVAGISAAQAAGAVLGAPLMCDFATISLSDLLMDWETIKKRIHAAASADMVICLYNPRSRTRVTQLETACDILRIYQRADTPVGIVWNALRDGQRHVITDLAALLQHPVDMRSIVIVGNSRTVVKDGRMITKRGYDIL